MESKRPRLLTAEQAKKLDKIAWIKFGISTLVLMENAGRAVAEEALSNLKRRGRIVVICGKGNNGGDGFVAARHLSAFGFEPQVILAGRIVEVKDEAKINLSILLKLRQKVIQASPENYLRIKEAILGADLIIDALLGTGLKGRTRQDISNLIEAINSSKKPVLSIDIPSGLDADTGEARGVCVKARKTVTFIAKKRGMVHRDGPRACGRIVIKDLGVGL